MNDRGKSHINDIKNPVSLILTDLRYRVFITHFINY